MAVLPTELQPPLHPRTTSEEQTIKQLITQQEIGAKMASVGEFQGKKQCLPNVTHKKSLLSPTLGFGVA